MNVIDIGYMQLGFAVALVVLCGVASLKLHLGLERDIFWGTVRTFAQLILMGFLLRILFDLEQPVVLLMVLVGMIFFAAWTVYGRVTEHRIPIFWPTFIAMLLSYVVMTVFATAVVIQVDPWYEPRYLIPIGGMIIGNSMNAIALALDRLTSFFRDSRREIEQYLALGGTPSEATQRGVRDSIRAGMIPTINSMMTVGIVFIPGMMTGQILAGADPMVAIRYQIMIMLLILIATTTGSILVVRLISRLSFTSAQQMRL